MRYYALLGLTQILGFAEDAGFALIGITRPRFALFHRLPFKSYILFPLRPGKYR